MSKWSELPIKERHLYIRAGVRNNITSLSDIRDKYNEFAEGGEVELYEEPNILGLKVPRFVETAASFVPILGTAMDIREAIKDPSFGNITSAILSTGADLTGLSLAKGLFKAGKVASKIKKAEKSLLLARESGDLVLFNRAYLNLDNARRGLMLLDPADDIAYSVLGKGFPITTDLFMNINLLVYKLSNSSQDSIDVNLLQTPSVPLLRELRVIGYNRPTDWEFYGKNQALIDSALTEEQRQLKHLLYLEYLEEAANGTYPPNGKPIYGYAEGGRLTDSEYIDIMERVANENWLNWGDESEYTAFHRILNDNSYDYRGYYNKYPNSKSNANTHWTDEFKTVYHPTFSDQSIYSPNNKNYVGITDFNPNGIPGGHWIRDSFIPSFQQVLNDLSIRL